MRGAYELTSAAGSPLPHLLAASTSYVDREIADTLILDGRGGGTNVDVVERELTDGTVPQRRRTVVDEQYAVNRDTLYFRASCPPHTMCLNVSLIGWFTDGVLITGVVDGTHTVVSQTVRSYRRIDWPIFERGSR